MSGTDWRKCCQDEWVLQGMAMPQNLDWKCVYEAKPFGRNLLKNPSPHGLSKAIPPPEHELPEFPMDGPPIAQPDGDYSGWSTSTEVLPDDRSGIPKGAVICGLPQYTWFTLEQTVDLNAEGLWGEMLDDFQPQIVIQDWYEESQVHESIYQLHVKLLGADQSTVISEHSVNPTEDLSAYSHKWKEVSHVFSGYGPGVRYIHFLHRMKNKFLNGFFPTMFTGSSVMVNPIKSSA
ncbi:F-box only protein 50 [Syngnathoides biaculeatus]|uniref:F-box only protein 50 n=1 Tax=Syngnathoides biaculeatus TaxID=300417 RepID=UPI002ADD32ED|nr:F-box only protein 50 [Syngnathoides biaculeatus]